LRVARSKTVIFSLVVFCALAGCGVYWIVRTVTNTLRSIAAHMGDVTHEVAAAASQISESSQTLAQGATEQAASLQDTSSSSEEINITSQKSAEGSRLAAEKMAEAAQSVAQANRTLSQMMTSMEAINSSSNRISRIIKVIDEIAFQTNILALNAAVESARAGEAGMGFAVVADEVRNLAQRCTEAARDTARLIEESIVLSQEGKARFNEVTQAIDNITRSAAEARSFVDGVTVTCHEQTRGIEHIVNAILQVDKVTQSTAASAEQNAAAGEALSSQSAALKEMAGRLIALV
jgi:methyl-accepting chemotaxis protein/methyl-accepting chemotaxis protein-1 (serine sensor receptor)